MRRALVLLSAATILAACGGSDAAPPVTETVAPSTVESTTTTDATTTTSTTTSSTSTPTTTSTTQPTIIETPSTDPADIDRTELLAETFAAYKESWEILRSAYVTPDDVSLRAEIEQRFDGPVLTRYVENLDAQVAAGSIAEPRPETPNSLTPVRLELSTEDGEFAQILVCETLTERVVNSASSEVVYDGIDSYLSRVDLTLVGDRWVVTSETIDETFAGQSTCDAT